MFATETDLSILHRAWPIAVAAWTIFIGGFLLLCLLHYNSAAWQSSDVLWFTSHIVLAAFVIPILWCGTADYDSVAVRSIAFLAQLAVGFVVYCVLGLLYIVEWARFTL